MPGLCRHPVSTSASLWRLLQAYCACQNGVDTAADTKTCVVTWLILITTPQAAVVRLALELEDAEPREWPEEVSQTDSARLESSC